MINSWLCLIPIYQHLKTRQTQPVHDWQVTSSRRGKYKPFVLPLSRIENFNKGYRHAIRPKAYTCSFWTKNSRAFRGHSGTTILVFQGSCSLVSNAEFLHTGRSTTKMQITHTYLSVDGCMQRTRLKRTGQMSLRRCVLLTCGNCRVLNKTTTETDPLHLTAHRIINTLTHDVKTGVEN